MIPLITNTYGRVLETLCWIKITDKNRLLATLEMISVLYLHIWILIIFSIYAVFKINKALENENDYD
jgi:hypothetical protein